VTGLSRSRWMYAIILAIAIFAVVGIYGVHPIRYGLSAPDNPSSLEAVLVRRSRRWAIPERQESHKPNACDSGNVGARREPLGGSLRNMSCQQREWRKRDGKESLP
jgi:hypothetical protein